jgi:Raf kinase inhibitor-like YbhB/YbcL family protein
MHMRHHRAWKSLRWITIALATLTISAFALAPRLAATGHAALAAHSDPPVFTLTSPNFAPNGPIADAQAFNAAGCTPSGAPGGNIPPTLTWTGGATGFTPNPTRSYALTVVDYDAPVAGGFHHWIVYNIPGNATTLDAATLAQATQGLNDFGFDGYGGPCPPRTGQTHHYIFTLYALTDPSIGGEGKTFDQLVAAMGVQHSSHVNGATVLIGTFTNPAS